MTEGCDEISEKYSLVSSESINVFPMHDSEEIFDFNGSGKIYCHQLYCVMKFRLFKMN